MRGLLELSPEVAAALDRGRPVVALESTIISHGMPHPQNLEMAREVEAIIRAEGPVPATIAVLEGRCKVGLSGTELERLATEPGVAKVSLRDLPVVLARRQPGATTVAATATIAEAAGIRVFVTGGIGGVHRAGSGGTGAAGPGFLDLPVTPAAPALAQVWDISADLTVLGRSSITVVCAGAKSVLDISATLEVLETLGVTVVGYRTDRFPGFYTRETGHGVDARAESPAEVAAIIRCRSEAALPGGVLVVNPLPESHALDSAEVEAHLAEALAEMARQGISGKAVTPFLLARMKAVTQGRSLTANLALIRSNARLGAQIAVSL